MTDDQQLVGLIDESADQAFYRVAALVVRADQMEPLRLGLDYVAARAAHDFGVAAGVELHGHEIFHGNEGWQQMKKMHRARIAVYGQALDVVARHSEAILIKGVERRRFRARYANRPDWNEHENALTFLIEELDGYAQRDGNPMSLYADNCRFAASTIAHLARFQQWGTWGYKARRIEHIEDLIYLDSAATREIQAADLVSYLNHRIKSKRDRDPRAIKANEQLWARVSHLVTFDHDWYP